MVKYGKLIEPEQQLCYAHGIHLAVCDFLYSLNSTCIKEIIYNGDDDGYLASDDEILDDDDTMTDLSGDIDYSIPPPLLRTWIEEVISKVRRIVRLFRRSPVKNSILQNIWQCLKPIEIAVSALCRRGATLLSAEGVYRFLMDQLDKNSSISFCQELKSTLEMRFREKRQVNIVDLHRYLLNPGEISRSQKNTLVSTARSLLLRLFSNEISGIDRELFDGERNL